MGSTVDDAASRASKIVRTPLDVFVFASVEGEGNSDRVHFTSAGPALSLEPSDTVANVLADVKSSKTWLELGGNLVNLPATVDWHWVEVFIVAQFSLDPAVASDLDRCVEMLACFRDWLGSS